MATWGVSYRVGESQDRDLRYNEAKQSTVIPPECAADEAIAHGTVEQMMATNGEPDKPYAVYTNGTREDSGTYTVQVMIQTNA